MLYLYRSRLASPATVTWLWDLLIGRLGRLSASSTAVLGDSFLPLASSARITVSLSRVVGPMLRVVSVPVLWDGKSVWMAVSVRSDSDLDKQTTMIMSGLVFVALMYVCHNFRAKVKSSMLFLFSISSCCFKTEFEKMKLTSGPQWRCKHPPCLNQTACWEGTWPATGRSESWPESQTTERRLRSWSLNPGRKISENHWPLRKNTRDHRTRTHQRFSQSVQTKTNRWHSTL